MNQQVKTMTKKETPVPNPRQILNNYMKPNEHIMFSKGKHILITIVFGEKWFLKKKHINQGVQLKRVLPHPSHSFMSFSVILGRWGSAKVCQARSSYAAGK